MTDELLESQVPVMELPPEVSQSEISLAPVFVVPLEDVIEYLFPEDSETEEPEEPEEATEEIIEPVDGDADIPVVDPVLGLLEDVISALGDLGKIEEHTKEIEHDTGEIQLDVMRIAEALDHPALTTPFADYTVTEALLLLLLLSVFISACARILRGGLSWLRS